MKKINFLLAIVALLFVVISFSSCSKAECVTCTIMTIETEYCDDMDYQMEDPNNPGTMITFLCAI